MSASVLYDAPGPRAISRNRILGIMTVVATIAFAAFIVYRLADTGQLTANKWELFGYGQIWGQIGGALLATLSAFAAAAVGSLIVGFLLAIARLSDHAAVNWPARIVIEVLRAIPVLVFMMLLYYGLPIVGIRMSPYWAVVIALICYNGSVLAEVFRAGVEALPRGQAEAGYAIGLRKSGVMMSILLPQAIRAMLPVIISQLVVTLKDTALGSIITYNELLYLAKFLGSQASLDRPIIPTTIVIGAIYILVCVLLSWIATVVQRRLSASPRTTDVAGATVEDGDAIAVGPGHAQLPATRTETIGTQQLAELDEEAHAHVGTADSGSSGMAPTDDPAPPPQPDRQ